MSMPLFSNFNLSFFCFKEENWVDMPRNLINSEPMLLGA